MDPFEPIPVDPVPPPAPPGADALPPAEGLPNLGPKFDAADVGLAAANAAAFIALSGIGGQMEEAVTGAAEAYGDPLVGTSDVIDQAVDRATDNVGPPTDLADGCGGCAAAVLAMLTLAAGSALAAFG
ncbi:MAG: hypothetical protein K2P78_03430 [Gemmataceae bacterium]|nr:hypothetical protein [Gemmataceae bacterium]